MHRLLVSALASMLPLPALAAGDIPLGFSVVLFLVMYLLGSIPAAGLGLVLGNFLSLPGSIFVLANLAMIPIGFVWAARGIEKAVQLAPAPFIALLFFSPLIYLGWRQAAKKRLVIRIPKTRS